MFTHVTASSPDLQLSQCNGVVQKHCVGPVIVIIRLKFLCIMNLCRALLCICVQCATLHLQKLFCNVDPSGVVFYESNQAAKTESGSR